MPSADSGLRHALIDSNLIASRAARIFIGQLAEHGQIMLGVNDTILVIFAQTPGKVQYGFVDLGGHPPLF